MVRCRRSSLVLVLRKRKRQPKGRKQSLMEQMGEECLLIITSKKPFHLFQNQKNQKWQKIQFFSSDFITKFPKNPKIYSILSTLNHFCFVNSSLVQKSQIHLITYNFEHIDAVCLFVC